MVFRLNERREISFPIRDKILFFLASAREIRNRRYGMRVKERFLVEGRN